MYTIHGTYDAKVFVVEPTVTEAGSLVAVDDRDPATVLMGTTR
jgi:hypothetical protein|tara:strand:+ start:697 stop:825 length:129 start_codon:yes stop_codon:yes gene_type:complete